MTEEKPLFKTPYDIKDVSALFAIVAVSYTHLTLPTIYSV